MHNNRQQFIIAERATGITGIVLGVIIGILLGLPQYMWMNVLMGILFLPAEIFSLTRQGFSTSFFEWVRLAATFYPVAAMAGYTICTFWVKQRTGSAGYGFWAAIRAAGVTSLVAYIPYLITMRITAGSFYTTMQASDVLDTIPICFVVLLLSLILALFGGCLGAITLPWWQERWIRSRRKVE